MLLAFAFGRAALLGALGGASLAGRALDACPHDAEPTLPDRPLEPPLPRHDESGDELHLDDFEHPTTIVTHRRPSPEVGEHPDSASDHLALH